MVFGVIRLSILRNLDSFLSVLLEKNGYGAASTVLGLGSSVSGDRARETKNKKTFLGDTDSHRCLGRERFDGEFISLALCRSYE
jgi:hypothetical protein